MFANGAATAAFAAASRNDRPLMAAEMGTGPGNVSQLHYMATIYGESYVKGITGYYAWLAQNKEPALVKSITVDQTKAEVVVVYSDGNTATLTAAVGAPENQITATGTVRGTALGPVNEGIIDGDVSWQQNNNNPYGRAIILVDGTSGRHIHGTNGPLNGGIEFLGGSEPSGRCFTSGCARLSNTDIFSLKNEVDASLNAGNSINVHFH